MRRSALLILLLSLLGACESYLASPERSRMNEDTSTSSSHEISFRFTLDLETSDLIAEELALGVTIREAESGIIVQRGWVDYLVERSPLNEPTPMGSSISASSLRALSSIELQSGSYEVSFYLKRDELNLTDHVDTPEESRCPIPYSPRSPFAVSTVDPSVGAWSGALQSDLTVEVALASQTCGPGEPSTRLSGVISLPSTLSEAARGRLMLHLSPDSDILGEDLATSSSLSFPLTPYLTQLEGEINLYRFSINHLPVGAFSSSIFVDSDGDYLPTPCDPERGVGGDRWFATSPSRLITLTRGEEVVGSELWSLGSVDACVALQYDPLRDLSDSAVTELDLNDPEREVIFLGQLKITPELLTALALSPTQQVWISTQRRALPPFRFMNARPLFSLSELLISDGRFSLHLPQGSLNEPSELALWIDEGGDGVLTPCDDPANRGADAWLWEGQSELLSILLDFDLSQPPPLSQIDISRRCDVPESLVEVNFDFRFSWPERTSSRPLILVYEDLLTQEVSESVITDLDAELISNGGLESPKELRLTAGTYLLSAYIDQDLDQIFTPCSERVLGDNLSTPNARVIQAQRDEVSTISLSMSARDCPRRDTELTINLSSVLDDQDFSSDLLSPEGYVGERYGVEVTCAPLELSVFVSDLNPLNLENARALTDQYCLPLEPSSTLLNPLPAGIYGLNVCALMSESSIERALEALGAGEVMNTWTDCVTPQVWEGTSQVNVSLSEPQPVELRLTPRCACD